MVASPDPRWLQGVLYTLVGLFDRVGLGTNVGKTFGMVCHPRQAAGNLSTAAYGQHRWELPGNYPVFTVVMEMYHYVKRIRRILVIPDFSYNIYAHEKYYPGEPVNIHIQSLINIIQDNNRVITTKKG